MDKAVIFTASVAHTKVAGWLQYGVLEAVWDSARSGYWLLCAAVNSLTKSLDSCPRAGDLHGRLARLSSTHTSVNRPPRVWEGRLGKVSWALSAEKAVPFWGSLCCNHCPGQSTWLSGIMKPLIGRVVLFCAPITRRTIERTAVRLRPQGRARPSRQVSIAGLLRDCVLAPASSRSLRCQRSKLFHCAEEQPPSPPISNVIPLDPHPSRPEVLRQ